jgi:hypothetical protein
MLTRRKLIAHTVQSILALGSIQYVSGCSQDDDEQPQGSPLHEYALGMVGISYIGAGCIEQNGFDSSTPDAELQLVLVERLQGLFATSGTQGSFQQKLDALIRKDFAGSRVIEVDGWQLSETECQLAALAASLQGHREAKPLEKIQPRTGQIVEVKDWGPKSTTQGDKFNEQPDGHSGLWFRAHGAPVSVVVVFAGKNQKTQVYPDLLTSGLRSQFMREVINAPGEYSVTLYDKTRRLIQPVGKFHVLEPGLPAPDMEDVDLDKCSVKDWGPNRAQAGKPFNPQPGGESSFWIKTNCALDGSTLILDGKHLDTTVGKNLLTALVPRGHQIEPGKYELGIKLGHSERILKAGVFRVE